MKSKTNWYSKEGVRVGREHRYMQKTVRNEKKKKVIVRHAIYGNVVVEESMSDKSNL